MHSSKPSARASLLKNLTFLSSFIPLYVCVFSCVLPVTYLKHSSTTAAFKRLVTHHTIHSIELNILIAVSKTNVYAHT
jgi:hypothetical protein